MYRTFLALGWLAYPLLIYFGLHVLQPRYVALLLAAGLLLRRRRQMQRFMADLTRLDQTILFCLLGLAGLTAVVNSELLLRLYPAAVATGVLLLFATSLHAPPSMIERFARLQQPDLPPEGVRYTRKVTQVWCAFLALNSLTALYTALFSSREVWSLYNGLIAYVLMGALFAGEWLVRKYIVKPQVS
ncbi:MAG TPA: hypothetical protein VN066_08830 [Rhodocyclaceae bacterium]|jgi:uncharacterized membrane protein|nr:hypothetical protein [Rhodocyclaceae bacterium]